MTNPFEDENGSYLVLQNDEKQYSLWAEAIEVPSGWTVAFGPQPRTDCLAFIETQWSDMRPASLVRLMDADARA